MSSLIRLAIALVIALALTVYVLGLPRAHAESLAQHAAWPDADTVRAIIIDRGAAHGVSAARLICVANKESRFNPLAINQFSRATGTFQWLPPYGGGNAWDWTSAARQGINIFHEYAIGNIDAVWFDIDMAAELFEKRLERIHWPETIRGC